MKTILIPTDFSIEANNAFSFAVEIAKKHNLEIVLLNVIEGVSDHTFESTGEYLPDDKRDDMYIMKLIEVNEAKLLQLVDQNKDVSIKWKLRMGRPFDEIISIENQLDIDLIIMGSHGVHGLLEEIFIGSNAERVLRRSNCPVLIVKEPMQVDKLGDLLFATDFHRHDNDLAKFSSSLAEILGKNLKIAMINHGAFVTETRKFNQLSKEFIERNNLENCDATLYTDYSIEKGVLHYAEDINAGIIALGTHARSYISHIIMGSTAEGLINHSRRPVISISHSSHPS